METAISGDASVEMPRYKCHKEVWAFKIKDITLGGVGPERTGGLIYPEEQGYAPVVIDQAYLDKHQPHVGGYYVVYKDGYKSFSPADAFEEGYSRVN